MSVFQDSYTPLTLKQNPSLGFVKGGVNKGKRREKGNLVPVGLEARHSDSGSLAVHSKDAGYRNLPNTGWSSSLKNTSIK